jgi:phosphate/sulfate permease
MKFDRDIPQNFLSRLRIAWAWIFTLPCSAAISALAYFLLKVFVIR